VVHERLDSTVTLVGLFSGQCMIVAPAKAVVQFDRATDVVKAGRNQWIPSPG
jgi:hypothetical protein